MSMTEEEALNDIMGEIYGTDEVVVDDVPVVEEEQAVVEEAPQEQIEVQPEVIQEEIQEPIVDAVDTRPVDANAELLSKLLEANTKQTEQNQILLEKLSQKEEEVQLTEEEMAMNELKARMGLDQIEQENQALKQQLEEIMQFKQEQQAQAQQMQEQQRLQQELRVEAQKFQKEFPDVQPDKIMEYIKMQPADSQPMFDTPQGWRMIATILKSNSQPTQTPDVMTTTQAPTVTKSASARKRAGEQVNDMDIVNEILKMSEGNF